MSRFLASLLAVTLSVLPASAARPLLTGQVDLVPGQESSNDSVGVVDSVANLLYTGSSNQNISITDLSTHVVVARVNVGVGSVRSLALDQVGHKLYAVNGGGSLFVLDTMTRQVTSVAIGDTNHTGVAVDHSLGRVYLVNGTTSGSILELDLSLTLLRTIPVGKNPIDVAVNPTTHTVFATAQSSANASLKSVYFIDPASNTFLNEVPLSADAQRIAYIASVNRLYISAPNDLAIQEVDVATHTFTKSIALDLYPTYFAASADKVYAGYFTSATVRVINVADDTLSAFPSAVTSLRNLVTNPANGDLFALEGSLAVHFSAAGQIRGAVLLASSPAAVATYPDRHTRYVADGGTPKLLVLNENGAITGSVSLSGIPGDVIVSPAQDRVYVTEPATGLLAAIDPANNTVLWERALGVETDPGTFVAYSPTFLALDDAHHKLFVLHQSQAYVSVVDTAIDGATTDPVAHTALGLLGTEARGLVLDQQGQRLLASVKQHVDAGLGTERDIVGLASMSVQGGAVTQAVTDPQTPNGMPLTQLVLDKVAGRVYAATKNSQGTEYIDAFTLGGGAPVLAGTITISPYLHVGPLAVNEASSRLYSLLADGNTQWTLHTISETSNQLEALFEPTVLNNPARLLYDASRQEVLATATSSDLGGQLEVYYDGPDTVAPTGSVTTPVTGSSFSALLLKQGTVTVADVRSGIASVMISLQNAQGQYWNGTAWVTSASEIYFSATAPTDGSGLYTFAFPTRAQGFVRGAYTLHALVKDGAGNPTTVASQFAIITPGSFAFSQAAYSVDENGGSATINVTRSGGADGPATVYYTLSDGTARLVESQQVITGHGFVYAGDYDTATDPLLNGPNLGFLRRFPLVFADGATQQTFTVPITPDVLIEGNQTINLGLQDFTPGAELGALSHAVLTIVDHPPASAAISHVATVPLLTGPQADNASQLTYNATTGKIYSIGTKSDPTGLYRNGIITILDGATGARESSFDLEGVPASNSGAAYGIDASQNRLYALLLRPQASYAGYDQFFYLTVFDLTTHQKIKETAIPNLYSYYTTVAAMQVDAQSHRVFMANAAGTVAVYDGATDELAPSLNIGSNSFDSRFSVNPVAGLLYFHTSGALYALDETSGLRTAIGGSTNFGNLMAVNNTTGIGYIQSYGGSGSQLTKISGTSALSSVAVAGDIRGMAVDADHNRVTVISVPSSGAVQILTYDGDSLSQIGNPIVVPTRSAYYGDMAIAPGSQKLFLGADTAEQNGFIQVVDLAAGQFLPSTLTSTHPYAAATIHTSSYDKTYVAPQGQSYLFVLDGATQAVSKQIVLPGSPSALTPIDSLGRLYFFCTISAYVAADQQVEDSTQFMVLDTATDTLLSLATIDLGVPLAKTQVYTGSFGQGNNLVADGAAKKLYVTTGDTGSPFVIFVVDIDPTHSSTFHHVVMQQTLAVESLAVNPVRHVLYASVAAGGSGNPHDLLTLDGTDLHTIGTAHYTSGSIFQTYQQGLAVDTALDHVYIQSYQEETFIVDVKPGSSTLNQVIGDLSSENVYTGIGYGSLNVAVNPITHHAFTTDFGFAQGVLGVIDGVTRTLTSTLGESGNSRGLAVNASTQKIYVANLNTGVVTVFADKPPVAASNLPIPTVPAFVAALPIVRGAAMSLSSSEVSSAAGLKVRFQYQLSGESDWTDLGYGTRTTNTFKLVTKSVPAGDLVFRAVASATGQGDQPSNYGSSYHVYAIAPLATPLLYSVAQNATTQKYSFAILDSVARTTNLVIQASVDGVNYTDLTGTTITPGATGRFVVTASNVPAGAGFFRAVAKNGISPDSLPSTIYSVYGVDVTVAARVPDGRVGAFLGTRVLNTTGAGQSRTFRAPPGVSETSVIRVVNSGTLPEVLQARGEEGDSQFIIRYYSTKGSPSAPTVDADVTDAVTDGSYALQFAPGATTSLIVEVITVAGTPRNTVKRIPITWISLSDTTKKDTALLLVASTVSANTVFVTNGNDSGEGSFRAALTYAQSHRGTTIEFEVAQGDGTFQTSNGSPVLYLHPATPYPVITMPGTIIDGTSQAEFMGLTLSLGTEPSVRIDGDEIDNFRQHGNSGLTGTPGLSIQAASCAIHGLTLSQFSTGVQIAKATTTSVVVDGCLLFGNYVAGVQLTNGARACVIGGTTYFLKNVFRATSFGANENYGQYGILIDGNASGNVVWGNYIGTNNNGAKNTAAPRGFVKAGVEIATGSTGNLIGGTLRAKRNIISGNLGTDQAPACGIEIFGAANIVQGNLIGLTAGELSSPVALPNGFGVSADTGANGTLIGSTDLNGRNVISGNAYQGVYLGALVEAPRVTGNYIGTSADGLTAIPNGSNGIVSNAHSAVIGGKGATSRNVISGNGQRGLLLGVPSNTISATNSVVLSNYIGVAADGHTALPNGLGGIEIDGSTGNLIGDGTAVDGNVIAHNHGEGILINGAVPLNVIRGNSIFANDKLGIDIKPAGEAVGDEVTRNDVGDNDGVTNYPELGTISIVKDKIVLSVTIVGKPSTQYAIDVYASDQPDAGTYGGLHFGEGQTYVGAAAGKTSATNGNTTFSITLAVSAKAYQGKYLSATSTKIPTGGSTSEFSPTVQVP